MNTEINMTDICRTCMKQFSKSKTKIHQKNQSIYEVPRGSQNSATIMELLQVVQPQIKIEIQDNFPTLMCLDCIKKLLVSHEFIETYQNADKKLRNMLKEVDTAESNYSFKELEDSLKITEEKKNIVETKYEFQVEAINIECIAKEEEESNNGENFEEEALHELSEETENKIPVFLNPYSDASDDDWLPNEDWQNISPKKNSECKIYDDSAKSTSSKMPRKNVKKNTELLSSVSSDDGSVSCDQCKLVFNDIIQFEQHVKEHQLEIEPKRKYTKKSDKPRKTQNTQKNFECKHCGKVFAKLSYCKNHMRIHTDEEPYLCIECGKSFKNISSLNIHMLRHKGEKTFQCPQCPKKFVCASGLYGHMMVHTKEKPCVCDICGSAFHFAYQLRKHNLYHNGIKNYQCEYCDMRFVTREKQRRHMRTHTGEKPYRCKYCERAFAQSNDCVKHLRQHLGDNVYQCELCPLRFPLARDLRAHFATHKDDDEETRARNIKARIEEERNLQIKLGSKQLE